MLFVLSGRVPYPRYDLPSFSTNYKSLLYDLFLSIVVLLIIFVADFFTLIITIIFLHRFCYVYFSIFFFGGMLDILSFGLRFSNIEKLICVDLFLGPSFWFR